jgi:hypothetical protein
MTRGTQNGFVVRHHATIKPLWIENARRARRDVKHRVRRKLFFIMQP